MNITIIGTGNMARAIGTRALSGGHKLSLLGHEASKAEGLAADLSGGAGGKASALATSAIAQDAEIVVLAVPYPAVASILQKYATQLAGKTIVDITNPMDFATMSPALPGDTSGAEEIAKVAPSSARVVKAFNTVFASTLLAGEVDGRLLDVFLAGDDADAKALVTALVSSGGMRAIDAGPLQRARQLEALGFLHIVLQFARNTGFSTSLKILP